MKKSMMKVMSMVLAIASIMSISAMSVSATEYNNEKYIGRPKSTFYYPEVAVEANYERPDLYKMKYTDDGRRVIRIFDDTDYVQDRDLNIAYSLTYFDDGDVMKVIDPNYQGYNKSQSLNPPSYTMTDDYSERPDDIRMGDFIVGIGKYRDYVAMEKNGDIIVGYVEFKSKYIAKKYVGKGGLVTIPEGVEALAPNLFKDNKSITKVIGPKSLMFLGEDCFLNTDVTHFVFHSDTYIKFGGTSMNFKGKTVIEFYTDAAKIHIGGTYFENYSGMFNLKDYNSKSNAVIYCYGERKGSLLDSVGLKAIYTSKIAYP